MVTRGAPSARNAVANASADGSSPCTKNTSRTFFKFMARAHAFAVKMFDNPDVHLLLEKKVEALALQRA